MSNYYHLLNKLEDLNLKHTREILPEYLDTIVQENLSFVEALNHLMTEEINSRNERQKNRLRKENLPFKKTIKGYSCHFVLSNELVNRLNRANQRGNLDRLLKKYASYDLLIIDEIGYLPFTPDGAKMFFQLINLRYKKNRPLLQ